MDLNSAFFAVTIFAVLLTGVSKSGFGGGLGVMSVPLMSLFVPPPFAAAVLMPILLVMDILVVYRYRKNWSRPVLLSLLPGASIGLTLGATFFHAMDADTVRLAIGCLALVFVAQFLLGQRRSGTTHRPWRGTSTILGAISGLASYIAHAGGPPVKGYLLSQNLDKTNFVGTNTMFFFALNATKTVAYGAFGSMTVESLQISLLVAPALFIGIFVGMRLHDLVDQQVFIRIVYGFLALTGAKLLSDSVPALLG
ncbi:MAG: sulfite exporter TauE/SafE family protein [Dinoroseobacter sp.]|nr:sulfite exporter TauE/SafE family protein [Dinoroseobacter sp.]